MRIEIATSRAQSAKDKGDLLEALAAELLRTQSYHVEEQVRSTAVELDLLCRHKVNNRQIYVECKAHRDPLSKGFGAIRHFWLSVIGLQPSLPSRVAGSASVLHKPWM